VSEPLRTLDAHFVMNAPSAVMGAPAPAQHISARRSLTRLIVGALLTAVVVLAFVTIDLRAHRKTDVLAVTTAIAAGQTLAPADVVAVAVSAEPGVPLIAAADLNQVIGRSAAVPLVRGELLVPRLLGPAAFPASGQAVIAVDVKPGRAPVGLQPGSSVLVLSAPADGTAPATPAVAPATPQASVVSVEDSADGSGDLTVSLLMNRDDAVTVATTGGDIDLVLVAAH
jgi:SAF domain